MPHKSKEAQKIYRQEWYEKNKEKIKERNILNAESIKEKRREYRFLNSDKLKAISKEYHHANKERANRLSREYGYKHRERLNIIAQERLRNNPHAKIAHSLRRRITNAVKNSQKAGSAVNDLGCSIVEFKDYISAKFTEGMSWDNYGEWHLDHIIPLASFDLTDREQFLKACHFSNYQPLWAVDNLKKGKQILSDGFEPTSQGLKNPHPRPLDELNT